MRIDDRKGIYLPDINSDKCNNCGLCYEICPGHSLDFKTLSISVFGKQPEDIRIGNFRNVYVSYANDRKIRYDGASGGIVTAVLLCALDNGIIDGALVTGMRKDVPWEPMPMIARTREDIIKAARSKYCPVSSNTALAEVLDQDGKYAVVGLPCHIHGLRKAQKRNKTLFDRVVLTIGLFCASGRSFRGLEALLMKLGLDKQDIRSLEFRGNGWPGSLTIETMTGKRIVSALEDYYPYMCCNDPYRCSLCPDKTSEFADISCGDAWIPGFNRENGAGRSICITRSDMGQSIVAQAVSDEAITLSPLADNLLFKSIKTENKKRTISGRRFVCKVLGNKVPNIHADLLPWGFRDLIEAFKHYSVMLLCSNKRTRGLYFFLRPKYRRIKFAVLNSDEHSSGRAPIK